MLDCQGRLDFVSKVFESSTMYFAPIEGSEGAGGGVEVLERVTHESSSFELRYKER